MSDDRRKIYSKKGTGTVPKIKYARNTIHSQEQEHNVVSNNLGRDHIPMNRHLRNSQRYLSTHYFGMEHPLDEANQNSISFSSIGSLHNSNEVNSRRNSTDTVPKCDNIARYPDKKQIEDKLNQIREYLHITSSLMSNMKNSDDQSCADMERDELEKTYNDLRDSESKLTAMLSDIDDYDKNDVEEERNVKVVENGVDNVSDSMTLPKNMLEKKVEQASHQLEMLKEQENLLLSLQQKAENQLREARQAQQKLMFHQNSNINHHFIDDNLSEITAHVLNDAGSNTSKKGNHDTKDFDDRWIALGIDPSPSRQNPNIQEQLQSQVDNLQQKVTQLRDSNDNRNQLIQLLDKRDVQLQSEHAELQGKLWELQNKKRQVDQLVFQIQNMDESEEEDMGAQVRKIVCMKEQLSKLKDMLEVVKSSENSFENQNVNESDSEMVEVANAVAPKSDNLTQNDVRTNQLINHENLSNTRLENNPGRSSNESRVKEKQVNKKTMNAQEKERLKLQAELQAKKRELEELMCKHKAASSNLNQDVHPENKTDLTNNTFEGITYPWYPVASNVYHVPNSNDQYSSDEGHEDDNNEYSEINSSEEPSNAHMVQSIGPTKFEVPLLEYMKYKPQFASFFASDEANTRASSRTPDNTSTIQPISNTTGLPKERVRSNSERDTQNKTQVQKQLELIRSVCDSMLEHQSMNKPQTSTQNVRNNLIPSPLYSEPRQFSSPNPHSMNALNVVNNPEAQWAPPSNPPNITLNDGSGYQNWLATNTLQTQAFMLNTLNQCCQMLWLQQREIAMLRNNVTTMQEKLQMPFDQNNMSSMYMPSNSCLYPPSVPESRESSQMRTLNPKANQVSSATSMPNLNHSHAPPTNLENAFALQNNLHNARILETGLNNTMPQGAAAGSHVNNTLLQGVNQPLPSQIWNGPALNNQVAPGNRANNYWDNFRSYSRQNLLSSKSNEGLQNQSPSIERLNNAAERTYSFPFAAQKRNTTFQDPSNSSAENTPRRRLFYKSSCPLPNVDGANSIPPDVLNVNDAHNSIKTNDILDRSILTPTFLNNPPALQSFVNTFAEVAPPPNNPQEAGQRNRNEWHSEENAQSTKSKLFEELRENVYKEVASLISANQTRPHFLIQLFRDLQLISSDPLRRQTLQSIQGLVSDSMTGAANAASMRQPSSAQNVGIENEAMESYPPYFEIPGAWSQHRNSELDPDCPAYLSDVLTFLNIHSEEILQQNLLESLKELLVESTFCSVFSNSTNPKDSIIQKHFAGLVTSAFEQYKGKRVQDVRLDILQTIEELLRGEISLIRLMRESISEANEMTSLLMHDQVSSTHFDVSEIDQTASAIDGVPQIQNGDLAEADQSRLEVEEEQEEEGAVGGVLGILNESNNNPQMTQDDLEMTKIDFATNAESDVEFSEQGLDQVPTRLTTHSRSKVNSSRDRSNSSRSDTEQF